MNNKLPKVCIIVVNWNGTQDTIECVESLLSIDYLNYEIIIVDNNSKYNLFENIAQKFPMLKIIRNNKNLGFSGGNNVGIGYALGIGAEYILLLNNDTTVEKHFLNNMVEAIWNNLSIGIAGAVNCYYDKKRIVWQVGGIYRPLVGLLKMPYSNLEYSTIKESILTLDYVPGSSLLIKTSMINDIGLLDENFFNQCEDLDWCLKTKYYGKHVVCVTSAIIYHKVSRSTPSCLSNYFWHRNLLRIHSIHSRSKLFVPQFIFIIYSILKATKYIFLNKSKMSYSICLGIADHFKNKYGMGSLNKIYSLGNNNL